MKKQIRKQQHFWAYIRHTDGEIERFDWDMFGTLDEAVLYAEGKTKAWEWQTLEVSTEPI